VCMLCISRHAGQGATDHSEERAGELAMLTSLQESSAAPAAAMEAFSGHSGAPDVDWGAVTREALLRKEVECPIWCVGVLGLPILCVCLAKVCLGVCSPSADSCPSFMSAAACART